MTKSVNVTELDLFTKDLKRLAEEMPEEVERIFLKATKDMEKEIIGSYQTVMDEHTGNLLKGVSSDTRQTGPGRVVGMVKSGAPHAWLVEFGSRERKHASGKSVGEMPERAPVRKAFDGKRRKIEGEIEKELFEAVYDKLKG